MDAALARAARICMRSALLFVRAATTTDADRWGSSSFAGARFACVGGWLFEKECFLIGLGFTLAAGRLILGAVFSALFLGIYVPVMRVEATTLAELFGEHYRRYAKSVPLFLPRLSPYRDPASERKKFDIGLYRRYREYRALLGLIVAWALLALRSLLFK